MNIHIISSMRRFDEDLAVIRAVADTLHKRGDTVALNWFEGVSDRKARGSVTEDSLDWPALVEDNINAIKQSDAVIIEGSRFNFSQGYQTAIALQHDKPVLNLFRDDLPEYKEWPDKFYVSGIFNPLYTSKPYRTIEEAQELTAKFLQKNERKFRELDVKLALEDTLYKKIEQISHDQGRSKAGVIKEILTRELLDK